MRQYNTSLESKRGANLRTGCNFSWYFSTTEAKIVKASGHLQNGGDIMPTLAFWRQLETQCMENNTGPQPGGIVRPMMSFRRPQIIEYHMEKVPNYQGKWILIEKHQKIQAEISKTALHKPLIMRELNTGIL